MRVDIASDARVRVEIPGASDVGLAFVDREILVSELRSQSRGEGNASRTATDNDETRLC